MEVSLKEIKELCDRTGGSHSFALGESYLIRCVTHYYLGRLAAITDADLVLDEASWVADTGRFSDCLRNGTVNEVEPFYGRVIVSRGAIVDATVWKHKLPSEQK